ncbi:MAG: winged helix-turn-helix domain-containing protein [Thermocladium sp.]
MPEVNAGDLFILTGALGGDLGDYILMPLDDFDVIFQSLNLKIVENVAKGRSTFTDIMRATGISRGQLARHLKSLVKAHWLRHDGKQYKLTASLIVVFDPVYSGGEIRLKLHNDRGAFIDPQYGMLIFRGTTGLCRTCPFREACVRNVKEMSRLYGITIRSIEPSEAYVEIFNTLVSRDLVKRLRKQPLAPI